MIAAAAQYFVVLFVMAHGAPTDGTIVAGPFRERGVCYAAAAGLVDTLSLAKQREYRGACSSNPEGAILETEIFTGAELAARSDRPQAGAAR
jgi:hypothetical protein